MTGVAIALAACNGARHIDEQLRSLADQRRLPEELVVVDDASDDDTAARVERFAATAPFAVRLYRNPERLGYRANFMRAAALCRSEVIAFCDQDDVWEAGKLAACLPPFDDPRVLLVYHDALTIGADGQPLAPLSQGLAQPMDYALGLTQLFRRSLLAASPCWDRSLDHKDLRRREKMAHDQWFFFLASVFGSIVHIGEALVRYRQHGGNAYGWRAPSRLTALRWRLWPSLRGRAQQYAALEAGAAARAAILARLAEMLAGDWPERAAAAALKYRALQELYAQRRRLYGSMSLPDRAGAFRGLLASRGYRAKEAWGLGPKALFADFCLGVPAGYRLSAPMPEEDRR
ncbi:MAG TPA: glycosyltransferase [Stellaceae bacterium]|nr:glycosyltransferase [Stellaceae bacterium]